MVCGDVRASMLCWSLGLCEYGSVWADGVFDDAGLRKCRMLGGAGGGGAGRLVLGDAVIIAVFKKTCEKNGLCSAWLALLPRLPAAEGRCVRARLRLQISRERWPHRLFYTAFYSNLRQLESSNSAAASEAGPD